MDFLINTDELEAICGLLHIQQLTYLRGIRPYMDVKTGVVGVKRRISYQSIAEQLYVEPHQGIKSQSWSRDQVRRAVAGLARAGIITVQSEGMHLILKCQLATLGYFVQNKAAINPPHKSIINPLEKSLANTVLTEIELLKADMAERHKAATPLSEDNYYIFLLSQFEKFWMLYPLKKSKQKAWEQFQALKPNPNLCSHILQALESQITHAQQLQKQGQWIAAWKYPANWLAQQCWNDELTQDESQERGHARHRSDYTKQTAGDSLWDSCKSGLEEESNIVDLFDYRSSSQAY
ncbi:MAG: hypothetical protein J0I93_13170 [Legionella sp.]|nr:hypothetical protein [Legionella sp.]